MFSAEVFCDVLSLKTVWLKWPRGWSMKVIFMIINTNRGIQTAYLGMSMKLYLAFVWLYWDKFWSCELNSVCFLLSLLWVDVQIIWKWPMCVVFDVVWCLVWCRVWCLLSSVVWCLVLCGLVCGVLFGVMWCLVWCGVWCGVVFGVVLGVVWCLMRCNVCPFCLVWVGSASD